MPRWSETVEEREARVGDSDEVWIKGFKSGDTKIRPAQVPGKWTPYYEHYLEGFGYFPCTLEKDCLGCTDPSPKVREKQKRIAFNALDSNGRMQVYKIGSRLLKTFKARQQRLSANGDGDITDRDYTIIRLGSGFNDTTYDLEPGEKYEVEFPALHSIDDLLENKYAQVEAYYSGDREGGSDEPSDDHPDTSDDEKPVAAPKGSKAKEEAKPEPEAPAAKPEAKQPPADDAGTDDTAAWEQLSAKAIRERLAAWNAANPNRQVDFNDRTPRSRLISMAVAEEVPTF